MIKELGTNGGGFYNANSAHPFENPTTWTNWLELFLILLIPFSLPRLFGRMVGDKRQGLAIASIMAILAVASIALINTFQLVHPGTVPTAVGGATEGTEVRFGVSNSATFAACTTLTSTGAVNSFHDSYTAGGGLMTMFNMMLGEVAPGGTGSGLYGMLILAVITVFVAGLMVGRTPEYLGKKLGPREMKFASLYLLITPALVLIGTALAMSIPSARASMLNSGPHGLSEVLYAFTSASNNNGSAFAGISVNTALVQHRAGSVHAARPVPADHLRSRAGRFAGQAAAGTRVGRHLADPQATVRRHGRRRDRHRRRLDIPTRPRARPAGRGL